MDIFSDDVLIKKIQAGDHRSFDLLFARYKKPLFGFIYHMVRNKTDAEDIFQETFFKVIKNIGTYMHQGKFKSWIFKIAHNELRERLRKEHGIKTSSLDAPLSTGEAAEFTLKDVLQQDRAQADDILAQKELSSNLSKAITNLPEEQRKVFLMREQSGLPFKEIAKILGCSINTALGRMHYALLHLRKQLSHLYAGEI